MAPKKAAAAQDTNEKHKHPLQAVLFADSWTNTFRPISLEHPKVLFPLANVPMLEYTLEFLASNGVEEVLIFCTGNSAAIEAFLSTSTTAQTVKTQIILSPSCLTAGDAIRELDRMQVVRSDPFILISGDVVSNMNLRGAVEAHEARRKKDSSSIMTMVFKEVQVHHNIRPLTDDLVVALDSRTHQLVLYETKHPSTATVFLSNAAFQDHRQISFRYDLMDAQIDICSPDVLVQFSDNFDYQDIRSDFVRNEAQNYEMGNKIHAHIIAKDFAARVHDPRTYSAITHAILQRWMYPLVPDNNLLGLYSTYSHQRHDIYKEKQVVLARTCTIQSTTILGEGTSVGAKTFVDKSAIGRNCKIGANVKILGSFLWDDVVVEDNVTIEGAILCNGAIVRHGATVNEGSLIAHGVVVGPNFAVPAHTKLTTVRCVAMDDGFSDDESDADKNDDGEGADEAWNPAHVGVGGVGRVWTVQDEGGMDSDLEDDEEATASRLEQLKLTLIGAPELVAKQRSRLASWDALSSSDDEETTVPFDDEDPLERFIRVVMDMVVSGDHGGDGVDNLFLEIKSYKFAQNRSFADCLAAILPGLCSLIPRANKSGMQILSLLKPKLEKWSGVVNKCIMGDVERVAIVEILAAYCLDPANAATYAGLFRFVLQIAYDLEWVTEDNIFEWEENEDAPGHPTLVDDPAVQEFLEWLRGDEDEEDDDDDDDDE
ncbi:hypothetical protein H310_14104 [Aphanomyces invadans]|uniref:Translation initiation factor eIF2B subunit epsilon n=1 Tax=Aphanomyces invadans TaxID=157072 RepID=A0A024TAS1_9STRA|nr:hypothetical protein H310_14104 [Aphanomyces invadans]ETV91245.1 hypothetical protein H310_14104 [Aphanomyces invadans]|eukprot:XP_008880082.1 hypothetical protein H310_14104 [Aphanomyces invadans]